MTRRFQMTHFRGEQFKEDIITVVAGYYLRYNLSYREVSKIMNSRGINICHTAIYRWVQEYSQIIYCPWKKRSKPVGDSWRMDETHIKIRERWRYLCRTADSSGLTLDIWLRKNHGGQAVYVFFKRLIKQFREPRVIVTDRASSLSCAFKQLKPEGFFVSSIHRTSKYLSSITEQDHRPIKKRHKLYQSLRAASSTIKGTETIHALYKISQRDGNLSGLSMINEINQSLGVTA